MRPWIVYRCSASCVWQTEHPKGCLGSFRTTHKPAIGTTQLFLISWCKQVASWFPVSYFTSLPWHADKVYVANVHAFAHSGKRVIRSDCASLRPRLKAMGCSLWLKLPSHQTNDHGQRIHFEAARYLSAKCTEASHPHLV